MAIPFLGAVAAVVATGGAVKTIDALDDMSIAKNINKEAQRIAESATDRRESTRRKTENCLENLGKNKINIMAGNMRDFVDTFGRINNPPRLKNSIGIDELKEFTPNSREFLDMKMASFKASELASGGLGAIGSGALTAVAAYGGVATFGAASTGTAIAGLSGAAATNATLAWLGGGALSAGGAGVAGGAAVLGGLVAAPALVVAGLFLGAKADEALSDARANRDKACLYNQQIQNMCTAMDAIAIRANQISDLLKDLDGKLANATHGLKLVIDLCGTDGNTYNDSAIDKVEIAVAVARMTKGVIDTSMLTESGGLTDESLKMINNTKVKLQEIGSKI